jgi:hypothetical protein
MGIFLSFLPWIGFMVLADTVGVRWSALLAGVLAGAVAARGGFKLLDLKGSAFFLLLFGGSFFIPDAVLTAWASVLSAAAIFLITLTSILTGKPFTTPYAKEMTPADVWESPVFKRANLVISTGWAVGFGVALAAALLGAMTSLGRPWLQPAAQTVAIAGPLLFQNWYRQKLDG